MSSTSATAAFCRWAAPTSGATSSTASTSAADLAGAELFALTTPLLTTSSGAKMGKTETGAVWLNAEMMRPYDYWQFWRNCEDGDVGRLLKLFTELPLDEIARLAALKGQELNEAKKVLATEATAILHGREAADQAAETARRTFEEGALAETLPSVEIARARLEAGLGVLAAFVEAGLVSSNGEARRHIKGGGLRVNDVTVADEKMTADAGASHAGRRHQALARTKAPRPAQAGVTGPGRRAASRDRVRRVLLLEFEGRGVAARRTRERMGHERGLGRHRPDHADRHGARAMRTGCRRVGL